MSGRFLLHLCPSTCACSLIYIGLLCPAAVHIARCTLFTTLHTAGTRSILLLWVFPWHPSGLRRSWAQFCNHGRPFGARASHGDAAATSRSKGRPWGKTALGRPRQWARTPRTGSIGLARLRWTRVKTALRALGPRTALRAPDPRTGRITSTQIVRVAGPMHFCSTCFCMCYGGAPNRVVCNDGLESRHRPRLRRLA